MTSMELRAQDTADRTTMVWTEGYDGQAHYGAVLKALIPALFILAVATFLMLVIL